MLFSKKSCNFAAIKNDIMRIERLELRNFRCFEHISAKLHPKMNVMVGINGTGKTTMLEAIRKSGLSSTCACVVRYFGGIKLGAGGLIRAYSGSVTDALAEAKKLDKVPVDVWQITYPYDLSGKLEGWLRRNTENAEFDYSDQVTCLFETREDGIADTIRDLTRGAAEAELVEHTFREVEVA